MKKYLLLIMMMALTSFSWAQGESNIWMFGRCNSIHFTGSGPVYGGVPGTGVNNTGNLPFNRSNAVCDANGNLLFYVKMKNNPNFPPSLNTPYGGKNIYNALGQPMDNSYLVTSVPVKGPVQIIKKPGNNAEYYVIYSLNQALLSTTVDMSLNGGLGGVVVAEKGVLLSGWQTIVGQKTVVIQGCDCIWLVARSRTANAYKAYRVTEAGIDLNPVISECGLLPMVSYQDAMSGPPGGVTGGLVGSAGLGYTGLLKASPDGKRIVACCAGALELYHFSKCSGRLSHPVLLDTASTQTICYPASSCGPAYCNENYPLSYYSACFSPDGSKLYATYFYGRNVYQFDLSLPTVQAIMNSKVGVLRNRFVTESCWPFTCDLIDTTGMGDLKLGPDGKIYIGNNTMGSCNSFPGQSQYHALHAINNPNLAGMACNPQQEAFILGPVAESKYQTGVDFNPAIVMPPPPRDTLTSTQQVSFCFGGLLQADTPGDCYHWSTGSDSSSAFADTSGQYRVTWSGDNCAYHIDTFKVHIVQPPLLFVAGNSCINEATGLAYTLNAPGDTTMFTYRWENSSGTLLKTASSPQGDSLGGLPPGDYRLQVSTAAGCDTTLAFTVESLPMPALPYLPDTTVCRGRHLQFNSPPGVTVAYWIFGDGGTSTALNPLHPYGDAGDFYPAVVVSNAAGCRDTAFGSVHVKALELSLRADSGVLDKGSRLELRTYADKPYSVVQWKPFALFPQQNNKRQTIYPQATVRVSVKAVSGLGCEDTAGLEVFVKPDLQMPTAFSPNGDGLNDYFKPFAWGRGYKVITFRVFNRWGQMVYDSFGDAAMEGWGGTYGGKAAEAGVYYYRIDVSTKYGESIRKEGDVTLVR